MATKPVTDLKPGDRTLWYEVLEVAEEPGAFVARVQFRDGGIEYRTWHPTTEIEVEVL